MALAVDWVGDNRGPSGGGLHGALTQLRERFPGAHVHASTFTAFFAEASKPENKGKLPVVPPPADKPPDFYFGISLKGLGFTIYVTCKYNYVFS